MAVRSLQAEVDNGPLGASIPEAVVAVNFCQGSAVAVSQTAEVVGEVLGDEEGVGGHSVHAACRVGQKRVVSILLGGNNGDGGRTVVMRLVVGADGLRSWDVWL